MRLRPSQQRTSLYRAPSGSPVRRDRSSPARPSAVSLPGTEPRFCPAAEAAGETPISPAPSHGEEAIPLPGREGTRATIRARVALGAAFAGQSRLRARRPPQVRAPRLGAYLRTVAPLPKHPGSPPRFSGGDFIPVASGAAVPVGAQPRPRH